MDSATFSFTWLSIESFGPNIILQISHFSFLLLFRIIIIQSWLICFCYYWCSCNIRTILVTTMASFYHRWHDGLHTNTTSSNSKWHQRYLSLWLLGTSTTDPNRRLLARSNQGGDSLAGRRACVFAAASFRGAVGRQRRLLTIFLLAWRPQRPVTSRCRTLALSCTSPCSLWTPLSLYRLSALLIHSWSCLLSPLLQRTRGECPRRGFCCSLRLLLFAFFFFDVLHRIRCRDMRMYLVLFNLYGRTKTNLSLRSHGIVLYEGETPQRTDANAAARFLCRRTDVFLFLMHFFYYLLYAYALFYYIRCDFWPSFVIWRRRWIRIAPLFVLKTRRPSVLCPAKQRTYSVRHTSKFKTTGIVAEI